MKRFAISAVLFSFLKRAFAFVLLAFSAFALAQAPAIKSGSTVYIEPTMESGFEIYLSTAFIKVGVPLLVVTDKDKAEYIIKCNAKQLVKSSWRTSWTDVRATFIVVDPRSSQIMFSGSSTYKYTLNDAAEDCAKQLKRYMTDGTKKKR